MSRIGLKPIVLPANVQVTVEDGGEYGYKIVTVKGPKGELVQSLRRNVDLVMKDNTIELTRMNDNKDSKSFHGLYRSLLNNMIQGVSTGYIKELHIEGIGYRAQMLGNAIELSIGFSHKVTLTPPVGVVVEVTDQTEVKISGYDKQKVGEFAAKIREHKKPEPYKGKGIRYKDEQIKRKTVKSA